MDEVQLRCALTKTFRQLDAVYVAHLKAHLHVERMQAKKPTASREALDAATSKRERTAYAYGCVIRKISRIEGEMMARGISRWNVLCSAGMKGDCASCRSRQMKEQRQGIAQPDDPRSEALKVKSRVRDYPSSVESMTYSGDRLRPLDLEGSR